MPDSRGRAALESTRLVRMFTRIPRCLQFGRVGRTQASAQAQLASLQALTDTAITTLDVDDLLDELLSRVQEALDADTAAVLLLAEGAGELVATAARGIEEEVREGVRVPLGTGFAGRIAASRGPIRLDRVDATTVANPILWEKGIKVMLGVPLLSRRPASRRAARRAAREPTLH